ncbi:dihydroxyacetone kinase subunit DhaL [Streptomyces sp. 35G-GA-8]|uniref:dihydroxyacetone kinase subunit DhaL n=1 Tax=Streptomyces sp. 35G-GA-8 TaxID=2939434 RepID=UPI00201E7D26|nr:dihydroxyacetone kinase subunit DhaL [Streptomyces sp. 35G-GA-8]MCL7375953.1 dihydroxyacetone kinase subunit DhaL [Streptomyces sp. 35G-GA-8]
MDNERAFGDLDAVAGDGDFGYSLARGFEIVLSDWDALASDSPAEFLKKVALVISKRVGGTSGPLWGTAFLRAAGAVKDRQELNAADAVAMLRAAAEGIKARGKSDLGDKTLLDALIPMTDALEQRLEQRPAAAEPAVGEPAAGEPAPGGAELAALAATTARAAADATAPMRARRGRQSYTGERSIGSPDPGAVAIAVMAERVAAEWDVRE